MDKCEFKEAKQLLFIFKDNEYKGDLNNLYTYYRIRFYLEIISFIIAILAVLITVNIKICFKNGIADDIIANKYYFNKKHILLIPGIIILKYLNKKI